MVVFAVYSNIRGFLWLISNMRGKLTHIELRIRGPFLEGPEMLSYLESCSKISNFMIIELFYSHIFDVNRGSPHTRSFSCIHFSILRKR